MLVLRQAARRATSAGVRFHSLAPAPRTARLNHTPSQQTFSTSTLPDSKQAPSKPTATPKPTKPEYALTISLNADVDKATTRAFVRKAMEKMKSFLWHDAPEPADDATLSFVFVKCKFFAPAFGTNVVGEYVYSDARRVTQAQMEAFVWELEDMPETESAEVGLRVSMMERPDPVRSRLMREACRALEAAKGGSS